MRFTRSAVIVVAGLVLGAAAPSAFAAPSSADEGIARAGVLTLQDFPAGWAPKPRSSSDTALTRKLFSTVPVCKPVRSLLGNTKTATKAQSRSDFTDGTLTASSSVAVYPDVAHADRPIAAAKGPTFSTCFQRVLQQAIPVELVKSGHPSSSLKVGVAVQPANAGVNFGDDRAAFAATVTATAGGIVLSIYFEDIVVRVGRALDTFSFESQNSPNSDPVPSAVDASVSRLQAIP